MSLWTKQELTAIRKDPNLYISIPNPDGSAHKSTRIWVAEENENLYCRGGSGGGINSRWYRSAKREKRGHISAGGVEKNVSFEFPKDKKINDRIDQGYRKKYGGNPNLAPLLTGKSRQATVRLIPLN